MLRVHTILLASKRRLVRHYHRRATASRGEAREDLLARAARLDREVDMLQEQRSRWALLAPPTTPEYWIASYQSLVTLTEQLLSDMQAELPRISGRARQELLLSDMPELRRQLAAYRAELRGWQKRQLNAGIRRGEGRPPAADKRPRLRVLEAAEPVSADEDVGAGAPRRHPRGLGSAEEC